MVYFRELRSAREESQLGFRVRLWAQFILESCRSPVEQAALERFRYLLPNVLLAEIDDVSNFLYLTLFISHSIAFLRRFSSHPARYSSPRFRSFVETSQGMRATTR